MKQTQRSFHYSWGSGFVTEEAQVRGQYHSPTIQLLKYTEGEAAGGVSIRFCHYSHQGRFQRSPLLMSPEEIGQMRASLADAPELRDLLKRLVDESQGGDAIV
jgi:hypothetical protein